MASEIKVDTIVNAGGDNDSGIDLATNDNIKFNIAGSQKAIIDSTGRLLIGTDSGDAFNDDSMLRLQRAGDRVFIHIKTDADQNSGVLFGDVDDDVECAIEYEPANKALTLSTNNNTEAMRIDSSGDVFIGRTSAGNTGNGHSIRGADSAIFSRDASGETVQVCRNDSTGDLIQFRRNGTICGEIVNNGSTSVAYQTSSDYRLKENVTTLANGIERIKQLKPYRFNFIAEPKTIVDGFFAHEAQTVVPECASGKKDEVDENGEPVMQGIDQSKLVPLLTKALQEAISEIDTLKEKVTALESK